MLSDIIKEQIRNKGPISFHDFMEMALYYPGLGYYTSPREKIGGNGDYFTSCNLTPAFGYSLARQIQQMWELSGEQDFSIIEVGAGTGLLCHDILEYFKAYPLLYQRLRYYIIEKSPVMRDLQKSLLKDSVSWIDSADEIDGITGCVLSNELLDNFSVHQVVMEDDLMEVFIDNKEGDFTELLRPANETLKQYLAWLGIILPKGFRTEVNLEAIEWLNEIAVRLKKGYILTIDYGASSDELYAPRKSCGTILCFSNHRINDMPYTNIGEQDITAHVNFSALIKQGKKAGLHCCGYTDQAHFLLALGFKEWLRELLQPGENLFQLVKKEQFLTHMLLVDMGKKFKVLIQSKGMPSHPLQGFNLG